MGQEVRLFVYGTFRRGFPRHSVLVNHSARFKCDGTIRGKLYDLGEYPGAVEHAESKIYGEIYAWEDDNGMMLSILDDVEAYDSRNPEGSLFVRRMVDVLCEDDSVRRCWVYFYNRSIGTARLIPSGDYNQR